MSHPNYPYPGYSQPGQPAGYPGSPYVQPGQYPPINQYPQPGYPPMNYAPGYAPPMSSASAYAPVHSMNAYPAQGNWPNNPPLHYPQMPNYPQPSYPPPNHYPMPGNYPGYGQVPPQGNYNQGYPQYPPGPMFYSSQPYAQYVTNPNVAYQSGYYPGQAEIMAVQPIDARRNESDNIKVNEETAEVVNRATSEQQAEEIKEKIIVEKGGEVEEGGICEAKEEAIEGQGKESVAGELNKYEELKEENLSSDKIGNNLEEPNFIKDKTEEFPELKVEGKLINVINPSEISEKVTDEKIELQESLIPTSNNSEPEKKNSSSITEIVVSSEEPNNESLSKGLESLMLSSPVEDSKEDLTPPSAPIISSQEELIEEINTEELQEKS